MAFHFFQSVGAIALASLFCTQAHAHGIWFAPRVNELAIVYGHGSEDLNVIKRQSIIAPVKAFDAFGAPVETQFVVTDRLLLVDVQRDPAFVTATMNNGLWTQGPDKKWVNKGKDEVPGALVSGKYLKYAVHIRKALDAPMPMLPEQLLQIVPVAKALPHHAGQPLKLKVLYQGKPVAGALVGHDYINDPDAKPKRTGKDGTVIIKVRNQGLNVISAEFEVPPDDPVKSSKTQHFATLSFILAHVPE